MSERKTKVWDVIKNPWKIVKHYGGKGYFKWIPDELYIKMCYRAAFNNWPNLDYPVTFNEKLNWLKLHDRKPIYTTMVDKYEAKKYVADIIGGEYIIPTLGVWNNFDDIDFEKLPDRFVLKCTHDSGGVIICHDKKKLDKGMARKVIEKSLKRKFYYVAREWPYKNVKPRIIAEKYMEDDITKELRDYKIFTFNGVAKALFIATERQVEGEETKFDFFDMDFNHLSLTNGHPCAKKHPAIPSTINTMKLLAEKLSKGIPHLRVDFYEVNGKVYFGELTFSHWGGFVPFEPNSWDKKFGDWINIKK